MSNQMQEPPSFDLLRKSWSHLPNLPGHHYFAPFTAEKVTRERERCVELALALDFDLPAVPGQSETEAEHEMRNQTEKAKLVKFIAKAAEVLSYVQHCLRGNRPGATRQLFVTVKLRRQGRGEIPTICLTAPPAPDLGFVDEGILVGYEDEFIAVGNGNDVISREENKARATWTRDAVNLAYKLLDDETGKPLENQPEKVADQPKKGWSVHWEHTTMSTRSMDSAGGFDLVPALHAVGETIIDLGTFGADE
ncbi:hypothetical protein GGS20DRAFT_11071 [Poronia punctata]|nr:hypothetical protein GGS20DRAFT_11071 [Poronia punctata]